MNRVLLAQTDTTVGFLSQDAKRLEEIKMRPENKPFLKVYADFRHLCNDIRIPLTHRRRVRHARKSTFIVKNQAFRAVLEGEHAHLVRRYGWLYSTSANESGKRYDPIFCTNAADWIIEDARGLHEAAASNIYKLGHLRYQKLR
jgi:tRNA A37 threonylcarbamoyladenosine synthetase subunit TsaC/SUA5/YrdC